MDEQPTCGKGLAEHSSLPAKLGELIDALADNLALHRKALDLRDENARKEDQAYRLLVAEQRAIAAQLEATARHMAGYRDLPMGAHDEQAMRKPELLAGFEVFVKIEQELLALLHAAVERDQQMLAGIRGAGDRT